MATSGDNTLDSVLSKEESDSIPEHVYVKIKTFIENNSEEYITLKGLFESSKSKYEERASALEKELEECKTALSEDQTKLSAILEELEGLKAKHEEAQAEVTKFRKSVERLEHDNNDLRRKRNVAEDERDSLIKVVDRRNAEVERLDLDVQRLTAELSAAVNAKWEALAVSNDVKCREAALNFKEETMKNEKDYLNTKVQKLTKDVMKYESEMSALRKEHSLRLVSLETQLATKTEELCIATDNNERLALINQDLTARVESMASRLMGAKESETLMMDTYQQELQAKTKLADLYKGIADESNSKIEELTDAVQHLQQLVVEAAEHYDKLEEKRAEELKNHEEILQEKNQCIQALQNELKDANDLLKTIKEETIQQTVEGLCPAASAASKLLKSGLSLTQIYSQYVATTKELFTVKEENEKLNHSINAIFEELQEKAPIFLKQRDNFENAVECVTSLCKQNDDLMYESQRLRAELSELKKLAGNHHREKDRLRQEVKDLSRQVCFLLKEVEEARGGTVSLEHDTSLDKSAGANDVIAKRLVTFRDVEDLQAKNHQLLAIVHELSSKQEDLETIQKDMDIPTLQENIKCLNTEVSNLRDDATQQKAMLDLVISQRDMYREMYEKTVKGENVTQEEKMDQTPPTQPSQKTPQAQSVITLAESAKDAQIKELQNRVDLLEKQLEKAKLEYKEYKKEMRTNEQMLTDQKDAWMTRIRELTFENAQLISQGQFQAERFNILKTKLDSEKSQISALEGRCTCYSSAIAKHEQSIQLLMEEVQTAQSNLAKVEQQAKILREENRDLKNSEALLRLEKENLNRGSSSQAQLLVNLVSIKNSLERTETEGRMRLEQRLDDATRECTALQRRLQEEQDRFRELAAKLERQKAAAMAQLAEERVIAGRARAEVIATQQELDKFPAMIEQLEAKVREGFRTPPVVIQKKDDQLGGHIRQMEERLAAAECEKKSLQDQLTKANEYTCQFRSIAESSQIEREEMVAVHKKEVEQLEKTLEEARNAEKALKEKAEQLDRRVVELEANGNKSMTDLSQRTAVLESQLYVLQKEKGSLEQERNDLRAQLDEVVAQLRNATDEKKAAEEKYAHEVVLHSNDIETLEMLKGEISRLNAEIAQLRVAKQQAVEALEACKSNVVEERKMQEMMDKLKEQSAQNSMLLDQLEALGKQLVLFQSKSPSVASASSAGSIPEEELRGSVQLLEVVKSLRRENEVSTAHLEALTDENARLRLDNELVVKQLSETREALQQVKCESATATSAQTQDVVRNALVDSNRSLRETRDSLLEKKQQLSQRVAELEVKLTQLEEQKRTLASQVDSASAEIVNLTQDRDLYKARTNSLIEQANKTSPEDFKKLKSERETLMKALTAQKVGHDKTKEMLATANRRNVSLEAELRSAQTELRSAQTELRSAQTELRTAQTELRTAQSELQSVQSQLQSAQTEVQSVQSESRSTQESAQKQVEELRAKIGSLEAEINEHKAARTQLTADVKKLEEENQSVVDKEGQVRRIARRYRNQYEELQKKFEELSKVMSDKQQVEAAAAGSAVLSADAQEQLREEGRRETEEKLRQTLSAQEEQIGGAEQRIRELETAYNEVTNQATTSREEALTLRQENETLRQREELLHNRIKSSQKAMSTLNDAKTSLEQQLKDSNNASMRHQKDSEESKKRMNVLKSQYESKLARAEKEKAEAVALAERAERERLQRELDDMSTRCTQLQRQLDKQSGKPSTSSGSERSSTEHPPTANIKPMAGPSSASNKQQTQQAATVSPWRAGNETPLASIRPIQTRMAAVSPQTTSSQQASTAVLVPVQQPSQQIPQPQSQPPSQPPQPATQQQPSQQQQQPVPPLVHAVAPAGVAVLPQAPQGAVPTLQAVAGGLSTALSAQQAVHTTDPATATLASGSGPASVPASGLASGPTSGPTSGPASGPGSMEATSSHTDYMPATSSAKQQVTVGPSTSRGGDDVIAESTQDMEVEGGGSRGSVVAIANVPQAAQQATATHPSQTGQTSQTSPQVQQQSQPTQQASAQRNASQQQGQQHAVAMVLPRERMEQQAQAQQVPAIQAQPQQEVPPQQPPQQQGAAPPLAGAVPIPTVPPQDEALQQQAGSVASSQQASSSSTVTTSASQSSLKRPRDSEGEGSQSRTEPKVAPQTKRSRRGMPGESFQAVESSDCGRLEVEYQVPTSSQRDQEDDIIVVTSEEDDDDDDDDDEPDEEDVEGIVDDGLVEDGSADEGGMDLEDNDGYAIEAYDRDDQVNYDDGEGPDIDDVNAGVNNEVEIIEDSNEVPSQTGRSDPVQAVGSTASLRSSPNPAQPQPQQQQQQQQQADQPQILQQQMIQQQSSSSEATSSGVVNQSDNGSSSGSGNGGVASPGLPFMGRGRASNRQQHLLLPQGYEGDTSDDCIVPSTPTLFVPRRTDGFGEAVSSPQVPSAGRFTFNESNQAANRAVAGCAGMDDTQMDLSHLEEPGTGRSVPTTPLQVSPQGENVGVDVSVEEGDCGSAGPNGESSIVVAVGEAIHGSAGLDIPTITVTGIDQQPGMNQGNLEMEAEQEEQRAEEPIQEPEEVLLLDVEDENGDGVSSEGQQLGQPLRPLAEEGREAEASRPSASSPQGSPIGSEIIARGGQTARRSPRAGFSFGRRGRASAGAGTSTRPKQPIVWNEPGSSSMSPRGGSSSSSSSGTSVNPMGRGMVQNQGLPPRGQRARRMRKAPYRGLQPPY